MYDLVIIGSGPAGLSAAQAAHDAGAKSVALLEAAKRLGGECPNWGCVPSKSFLRSSGVLGLARRAKEFGLNIPRVGFDFTAVMRRKNKIVDRLTGAGRIETVLKSLEVELIRGRATFVNKDEVEVVPTVAARGAKSPVVPARRLQAKAFVVAVGTEPFIPPVDGLTETGYLTSDDVMTLKRPPKSLVVVGGGPIACEVAEFLFAFGTKITIVEFAPHILPREDEETAATVAESFRYRGIKLLTASRVAAVVKRGGQVAATVVPAIGGEPKVVKADAVLVASGKRPALRQLALEKAGVELDKRGAPVLDEYLRSTNPNVYFAGDAAGQMMFTNVAHEMGEVAAENAVGGEPRRPNLSVVPRGTFCVPEVGSVGLTEKEAREAGFEVGIGRAPYAVCGKSLTAGEPDGVVKIVVDKKTGLVLGGHVCGQEAAEIVHELALAIYAKAPYQSLAEMVHAYPTYAECIRAAAGAVNGG